MNLLMLTHQPQAKKLAAALGLKTPLYLKREDLHPYGSHKGRSIPVMIKKYASAGQRDFVISSSGNAALAAGLFVRDYNRQHKTDPLSLAIFIGKNIDKKKLKKINNVILNEVKDPLKSTNKKKLRDSSAFDLRMTNNITVAQTANPKQSAFLLSKMGAQLLRQSTDDRALAGYAELYRELKRIKNLRSIFIPTSSGTTARGLFEASNGKLQIHIVQTAMCHPFIKSNSPAANKSLANAIVDKIGLRKKEILQALKKSHGAGYIATDKEIKNAITLASKTEKIKLSPNSALALVGLIKALRDGWQPTGPITLLITGK